MAVTVSSIVMQETYEGLPQYVRWANDLGVDRVLFQPISPTYGVPDTDPEWYSKSELFVHDIDKLDRIVDELIVLHSETGIVGNTVDNLVKLKDYFRNPNVTQLKKSRCMLGQTNLNINETGDMSFCYKFNTRFGNVDDGPIRRTWQGEDARRMRRIIKNCKRPCMSLCYRTFTLWEKVGIFFKYARQGRL